VECYQPIVSASERGLEFMAKMGMKGIMGGGAAIGGASERVANAWQETLARHGRETQLGGDLILGLTIHIADSEEQAIREATPFFEENLKMFAPLGFVRGLSDEQIAAAGDPARARSAGLPTLREAVAAGAWICGPAERIVERLKELEVRYPGLEAVNVGQPVGTPEAVILEQLDRFASEVMPAFRG